MKLYGSNEFIECYLFDEFGCNSLLLFPPCIVIISQKLNNTIRFEQRCNFVYELANYVHVKWKMGFG